MRPSALLLVAGFCSLALAQQTFTPCEPIPGSPNKCMCLGSKHYEKDARYTYHCCESQAYQEGPWQCLTMTDGVRFIGKTGVVMLDRHIIVPKDLIGDSASSSSTRDSGFQTGFFGNPDPYTQQGFNRRDPVFQYVPQQQQQRPASRSAPVITVRGQQPSGNQGDFEQQYQSQQYLRPPTGDSTRGQVQRVDTTENTGFQQPLMIGFGFDESPLIMPGVTQRQGELTYSGSAQGPQYPYLQRPQPQQQQQQNVAEYLRQPTFQQQQGQQPQQQQQQRPQQNSFSSQLAKFGLEGFGGPSFDTASAPQGVGDPGPYSFDFAKRDQDISQRQQFQQQLDLSGGGGGGFNSQLNAQAQNFFQNQGGQGGQFQGGQQQQQQQQQQQLFQPPQQQQRPQQQQQQQRPQQQQNQGLGGGYDPFGTGGFGNPGMSFIDSTADQRAQLLSPFNNENEPTVRNLADLRGGNPPGGNGGGQQQQQPQQQQQFGQQQQYLPPPPAGQIYQEVPLVNRNGAGPQSFFKLAPGPPAQTQPDVYSRLNLQQNELQQIAGGQGQGVRDYNNNYQPNTFSQQFPNDGGFGAFGQQQQQRQPPRQTGQGSQQVLDSPQSGFNVLDYGLPPRNRTPQQPKVSFGLEFVNHNLPLDGIEKLDTPDVNEPQGGQQQQQQQQQQGGFQQQNRFQQQSGLPQQNQFYQQQQRGQTDFQRFQQQYNPRQFNEEKPASSTTTTAKPDTSEKKST